MSSSGREQMVEPLVEPQEPFQLNLVAEKALEQVIRPLREWHGMTEEAIVATYAEMLASVSK